MCSTQATHSRTQGRTYWFIHQLIHWPTHAPMHARTNTPATHKAPHNASPFTAYSPPHPPSLGRFVRTRTHTFQIIQIGRLVPSNNMKQPQNDLGGVRTRPSDGESSEGWDGWIINLILEQFLRVLGSAKKMRQVNFIHICSFNTWIHPISTCLPHLYTLQERYNANI